MQRQVNNRYRQHTIALPVQASDLLREMAKDQGINVEQLIVNYLLAGLKPSEGAEPQTVLPEESKEQ